MKLQDLVLPAYAQMLEALRGQLEKARRAVESDGASIEALMSQRLAEDMFPLTSQVQFACMQAEEVMARLFSDEIKAVPAPQSFDEAITLISKTIERLRDASQADRPVDDSRPIELSVSPEMTFDLSLTDYVRSWAIPQFYFHLVTAYAIMRNQGVDLGKADYVPHMLAFLRKS